MARAATPFATDLFVGGQGGYHAYRIPAMSVSPQGSLIVFCEARKSSLSDHGDIDLLLRRSEDGGRTWLAPRLVIEEGGDAPIKYGNPTAVVDRETGSIWLAVNRDYLDPRGRRQGGRPLLLRSDDDGNSWLNPIDIYGADEKNRLEALRIRPRHPHSTAARPAPRPAHPAGQLSRVIRQTATKLVPRHLQRRSRQIIECRCGIGRKTGQVLKKGDAHVQTPATSVGGGGRGAACASLDASGPSAPAG
jgi:hypothetical protein